MHAVEILQYREVLWRRDQKPELARAVCRQDQRQPAQDQWRHQEYRRRDAVFDACHRGREAEYWRPMATASDRVRRARPLLGTFVEIEVAGSAKSGVNAAIDAAFEAVASVHRLMSFHEPDSDVSRLNREASVRPVSVHAWTYRVLEAAVEMHRRSNGMFDIAVAPTLQAMGLLPGPTMFRSTSRRHRLTQSNCSEANDSLSTSSLRGSILAELQKVSRSIGRWRFCVDPAWQAAW